MIVTTFPNKTTSTGSRLDLDWPAFLDLLRAERDIRTKDDQPQFAPAEFDDNRRLKKNTVTRGAIVIDVDNASHTIVTGRQLADPLRERNLTHAMYTTWSHTDDLPKFRVVIPLREPIQAADWKRWLPAAITAIGFTVYADSIDQPCLKNVASPFYLPCNGAKVIDFDGDPLDVAVPAAPTAQQKSIQRVALQKSKYATAAFQGEVTAIAGAPEGERNATLNRASFKLGTLVGAGQLDQADVEARIFGAAATSGLVHDSGASAVRDTIHRAVDAGRQNPRDIPEDYEPHLYSVDDTTPETWSDGLIKTAKGVPERLLANVMHALREHPSLARRIVYDVFGERLAVRGKVPWHRGKLDTWEDSDDALLAEFLQQHGLKVGRETVATAVDAVAREHPFHPVREYLDRLEWDGVERIEGWLHTYVGAEPAAYIQAVGPRWLVSAVARVYDPGCKADCMLVLEGDQGIGKSTAFGVLGGVWFTDEIADLGSKDASQQLAGAWIIEMAELDKLTKAETSETKAFLSRSIDRYRPPYGRRVIERPRQCIFGGTVNSSEWMKDESGGRRFWPIACGHIDLEALRANRDQLWAEAVHVYRAGQSWYVDSLSLSTMCAAEVADRQITDAWDEPIERYLIQHAMPTMAELLGDAIGVDRERQEPKHKMRIGRIMRRLGYKRHRGAAGLLGRSRERVYSK